MDVILPNLSYLLSGLATTAILALISIVAGTVLGVVLGTLRYTSLPVLSQTAAVYIEFTRGIPLLVFLFLFYFALPAIGGYKVSAYVAAAQGFSFFIAAYLAEDFRSGLRSVRPQLTQAARASGLTEFQVFRHIVLPIALRRIIPTLFNQYVRLFKFTSVASVIGVSELTGRAMLINAREFAPIAIIVTLALTYLVCCLALSSIGRALSHRFTVRT